MKFNRSPVVKPRSKTPTGLLGAERQSAAIMYVVARGGFLLVVIAHALLKDEVPETMGPAAGCAVVLT